MITEYFKCESKDNQRVGYLRVEGAKGVYDGFLIHPLKPLHITQEIDSPKPQMDWVKINSDEYAEGLLDTFELIKNPAKLFKRVVFPLLVISLN